MNYRLWTSAGALAFAWTVAACDPNLASMPARDHSAEAAVISTAAAVETEALDPRDAPVPDFAGRPMWSANANNTAEENARSHFERNGEVFGATSVEAYVQMAHAFTASPPPGAETVTRTSNGDRLIYDPKENVFAVVTRAGAPRTMFKPDDGPEYWARQKQIEADRAEGAN